MNVMIHDIPEIYDAAPAVLPGLPSDGLLLNDSSGVEPSGVTFSEVLKWSWYPSDLTESTLLPNCSEVEVLKNGCSPLWYVQVSSEYLLNWQDSMGIEGHNDHTSAVVSIIEQYLRYWPHAKDNGALRTQLEKGLLCQEHNRRSLYVGKALSRMWNNT